MKVLVNCDQVFDILTRGPFPTGEPSDEGVEHHLRACYECRQLAEALRPAVSLLHEAVGADQALDLPEYQGSLPVVRSWDDERLDIQPEGAVTREARRLNQGMRKLRTQRRPQPRRIPLERIVNATRLVAASILVVALATLVGGLFLPPPQGERLSAIPSSTPLPRQECALQPDTQGLLTLASLKLPPDCLPAGYSLQARSASFPTLLPAAEQRHALKCCTHCHAAGMPRELAAEQVAVMQRSCLACHRS